MLEDWKSPQAGRLHLLPGWQLYPRSVVEAESTTCFLVRRTVGTGKALAVVGDAAPFEGERQGDLLLCPLSAANAAALRAQLPWLNPQPLGLAKSVGCGDRLGLATPGHVRALQAVGGLAPVWAQQSMRENARTGRTAQQVIDDAMWGLFQEGWRDPWGADADHLKSTADVDLCLEAGYSFFTVDPGDHVDNAAHTAPLDLLEAKVQALPWGDLDDLPSSLHDRYLGCRFEVEGLSVEFDRVNLARAAAKYGRAIAHTTCLYRHLAAQAAQALVSRAFEFEMSVDETETPTSVEEHWFIASELKRLGVHCVSLAPRYVGRFEKGVDYIGSLTDFETEFARHAVIARTLGPYKLSLHTGSDKFSIYSIAVRHARGLVHLKTAGTSYLEALRAVAELDSRFFRQILDFAREHYDTDRATYHVSGQLANVPLTAEIDDANLPSLLDQFDARQVLHVTFGSVLDAFGPRLRAVLEGNEKIYYARLEAHFRRHLVPFLS
jgi:tagaturonate epimerase